ncbi:MAG TPA: phenylalanine--tRNA ligase subunit alpha [Candidatus Adamsella sp.]|nr:phenylalanine--tRNA ligase subunit alpha [Candidatus Adamsella sp.]
MRDKLQQIKIDALVLIDNAQTLEDIEDVKLKFLSRKGELNSFKKKIKDLPADQKPIIGALANEIAQELEQKLNDKLYILQREEILKRIESEKIDITMPGRGIYSGKKHPLTTTIDEIVEIFQGMGFSLVESQHSPEVETEHYNFDMLNFPPDHPARDMQDTFYTQLASNVILRSHTSNSQVREMQTKKPPLRVVIPGRVYRAEDVSSRKNNLFHQVEGFMVDKDITFGDMKGVLNEFIRLYFGQSRPTRFRSSFFPFTEPSAEIDVQCIMCKGKGCRVCSQSGWLEILGAGMIDPNVLKNAGIDPDVYSGFAFGMGVERLAMLKYAINDIRLFFNNDIRFLKQF